MSYEKKAIKAYKNDNQNKREKAIAAGKAIDNSLKVEYSKGGVTNSHFMLNNFLKYFSYEALGSERIKLLYGG